MMRVALVSFDFGEYCVRLASALSREAEVTLLLPWPVVEPYLHALDERVYLQPFGKPRLRQPGRQLRVCRDLVRRIKAFEPSVVHLQQGHLWFNGFLPLLRRHPIVLTVHDPQHHPGDRASQKTPQGIMDFGFRRATQLIVHARHSKEAVVERASVDPATVHVVPHISLVDGPELASGDEKAPTILFFGRIWQYKGLEYLIRAEPLITSAVPDARIVIAGHGEDFARYRRMMTHPERFIVYNEPLSDARRNQLFRQATVVVLPYIEASQSGVIPLAYAFMKPVVATTVGGLPDFVDQGRTGYLVPPHDERALAAAAVRLLRDRTLCREMGVRGKRKVDTECAPRVVAHQTLAVYRQALHARSGSGLHRNWPSQVA